MHPSATRRTARLALAGAAIALTLGATACSDSDGPTPATEVVTGTEIASIATTVAPDTTAAAAAAADPAATTGVRTIDVEAFDAALHTAPPRVLIDLRRPDEYALGHLTGSQELDFYAADFDAKLAALDKTQPYAIYCHSGNRSGQTADKMRALGFTDVVDMGGGIAAWEQAGKEIVK